ncbi:hypothetical protein [Uliginosibacterium sp. H1]|uniref:hypothetical protein n=1 Tax=Uliginosibacterium sp. H1 TaxID=3114757 RepID=UPI002E1989DB|nr:hypothetical protein [Uliginosibacterium sp. H1]
MPAGTEQFMAAPGDLRWPNKGRVTYVASVLWGILPLEGSGEQRWEHDGEGFRVRQVVGGLGREIVQESAGRILRGQPIIDGFRETRTNGRSAQALIDQANGSILQIRGEERRERKVEGAILDLVTLPHMLAAVGAQIDVVEFNAIGGFWVERVVVANEGEVEIELPLGRVMARRFHAETRQGQYKIDIWISRDWRGAPLRIRVDDRREGLRVDMRATEIELDGQIVASTPAPDRLRE